MSFRELFRNSVSRMSKFPILILSLVFAGSFLIELGLLNLSESSFVSGLFLSTGFLLIATVFSTLTSQHITKKSYIECLKRDNSRRTIHSSILLLSAAGTYLLAQDLLSLSELYHVGFSSIFILPATYLIYRNISISSKTNLQLSKIKQNKSAIASTFAKSLLFLFIPVLALEIIMYDAMPEIYLLVASLSYGLLYTFYGALTVELINELKLFLEE